MIKKFVTAASFALGGAGVVLVGYLSANPRAFTHPVAASPSPTASAPPSLTVESPLTAEPEGTLVLPEVTVSATAPNQRSSRRQLAKLQPCSDWTEIGATFIAPEGAIGSRRVRQLCDQGMPRLSASQ